MRLFFFSLFLISLLSLPFIAYADFTTTHGLGDIGIPKDYIKTQRTFPARTMETLPGTYDCRTYGWVTPAKNQGSCGGCWSYTATGVFESHLLKNGYPETNQQEYQQIYNNADMWGCDGGNMDSLRWWKEGDEKNASEHGPIETSYAETQSGTNYWSSAYADQYTQMPFRLTGYYTVDTSDTNAVKNSIRNDGPGYFRFNYYDDFGTYWSTAEAGAVYTQTSGTASGGHAVLIIGWDDDKAAWLCKNSWGETGGPDGDGTFWMAYTGHANDLEFGMANASGLESIDSAAPTVISKNTTSTQSFTATFSYVYDASQITPSTYGYCLDTDHTPSIGDAASCETLSPVDNSATISLSSGERVKNYIRPYMTDSNGVTYYSSTGISVTTCPDTATSLFWWNSEDNSLVRWKIAADAKLVFEDRFIGWGYLNSGSPIPSYLTFATLGEINSTPVLYFENNDSGMLAFMQLDEDFGSKSFAYASSMTFGSDWHVAGMLTLNEQPTLIWQNALSGLISYWKLDDSCGLSNSTQDDGWGFVSDEARLTSEWSYCGSLTVSGNTSLLWQNQQTGKVAWWRINASAKLVDSQQDSGWGFVSDDITLNANWSLVGVTSLGNYTGLIWQNLVNGQSIWWKVDGNGKLLSSTEGTGWGYITSDEKAASWKMRTVASVGGVCTIFLENEETGRIGFWQLNDDGQLVDDLEDSGWGFVSDKHVLTTWNIIQ